MDRPTNGARPRARGIIAVVTVIALLATGFGLSLAIGDALGISTQPAQRMGGTAAAVVEAMAPVPAPRLTLAEQPSDARLTAAADDLADALDSVGTQGEIALRLVVGDGADAGDDSFALSEDTSGLLIDAAGPIGAARGVYELADAVRQGRDVRDGIGAHPASRLGLRMTDLGAVGVVADPEEWRDGTDYSHASKAFAAVLTADPPYIDEEALADAYQDFDDYLRRVVSDGYNAIAFPGLVEFLTFGDAGVYPEGDGHIAKALALREAFTPFWDRAEELGVRIFLRTDMLTLTEPLEAYLTERFGSLDTENPELWDVYATAIDELYAAAPALDGVLIRIGEAGRVYDVEGWDYYSSLAVTTPDAVRSMLTVLSDQAERADRELIFRTWSVGVGAVGDMHTNSASYEAVLSGIDSPALIVSTKYTLGDFYSWLPLNDTLLQGEQRRIVEFQSRREFENNGAFPNDLGAEYAWALQTLLAGNDRIEGIWSWAQDGGPWRAGPMILYGKAGFWQLADLNSQLAVRLAMTPDADPAVITEDWIREWFSDDPATVEGIAAAMSLSRTAIEQGLYIAPYAEQRVAAIGLEPPPMMWIFEWDILTGDSAALDVIYAIVKDDLDAAVDGGAAAIAAVDEMQTLVEATDAGTWRDPALRDMMLGALAYEHDVLGLLGDYRAMVLAQAQWHDTLSAESYAAWQTARTAFSGSAAGHLRAYQGDVDHPAFNLTAAQLGVERADRDLAMSWWARALLLGVLCWLVLGAFGSRAGGTRTRAPSALRALGRAAAATWTAAVRPWRAGEGLVDPATRLLVVAVPGVVLVATRLVQTSFLSWTHPLLTLGAWGLFVALVLLLVRRRSPWPFLAAVGGVVVLRCALALFALSFSGPGGYWFAFWTDPVRRSLYVTVAVALFLWLFVAAGWALAIGLGRRRATGFVIAGIGAALAAPAAVIALAGLESALTLWNDELGLLPWGLSRILGITVYLDIPADTAAVAAGAGVALLAIGLVLAIPGRRRGAGLPPASGVGAAA